MKLEWVYFFDSAITFLFLVIFAMASQKLPSYHNNNLGHNYAWSWWKWSNRGPTSSFFAISGRFRSAIEKCQAVLVKLDPWCVLIWRQVLNKYKGWSGIPEISSDTWHFGLSDNQWLSKWIGSCWVWKKTSGSGRVSGTRWVLTLNAILVQEVGSGSGGRADLSDWTIAPGFQFQKSPPLALSKSFHHCHRILFQSSQAAWFDINRTENIVVQTKKSTTLHQISPEAEGIMKTGFIAGTQFRSLSCIVTHSLKECMFCKTSLNFPRLFKVVTWICQIFCLDLSKMWHELVKVITSICQDVTWMYFSPSAPPNITKISVDEDEFWIEVVD